MYAMDALPWTLYGRFHGRVSLSCSFSLFLLPLYFHDFISLPRSAWKLIFTPVFEESLRLNVRTVDASLKCEIWMLSRIRNFLEDQLLGFALVPLADIAMGHGKLVQEFSLSSTDLFHTPAGFMKLSSSYIGCSSDVVMIPSPKIWWEMIAWFLVSLKKKEFPDLNAVNENEIMVSKYLEMGSLDPEKPTKTESGKVLESGAAVPCAEISTDKLEEYRYESPLSCVSITGSSAAPSSEPTSDPSETTIEACQTQIQRQKSQGVTDGEAYSSEAPSKDEVVKPVISTNLQPEQPVVQQDIVDMYMKSL